jgi:hypothetical protein
MKKQCASTIELGGDMIAFEIQCQSRQGHAGAHTCKLLPFNEESLEIGIMDGAKLARINWITQSKSIDEILLQGESSDR